MWLLMSSLLRCWAFLPLSSLWGMKTYDAADTGNNSSQAEYNIVIRQLDKIVLHFCIASADIIDPEYRNPFVGVRLQCRISYLRFASLDSTKYFTSNATNSINRFQWILVILFHPLLKIYAKNANLGKLQVGFSTYLWSTVQAAALRA